MWRPKQKAPCETSGAATPQAHLSREDKGKMPACFAETISREARAATLPSPNPGAVTPCANLAPTSEVTDGLASTAQYLRVRTECPTVRLKLKHLAVLTTFATRWRAKHHSVLRSPTPKALSSLFAAELRDRPWVLIAVLMQLRRLRVLPKFLAAKLEHCLVPITSAVMRRTRHHPVFRFQSLRARRWCRNYLNTSMRDLPESLR